MITETVTRVILHCSRCNSPFKDDDYDQIALWTREELTDAFPADFSNWDDVQGWVRIGDRILCLGCWDVEDDDEETRCEKEPLRAADADAVAREQQTYGHDPMAALVAASERRDYYKARCAQMEADHAETVAEIEQLRAAEQRARELHRPYSLYDECGHSHQADEPGVVVVEDIGPVCQDGYLHTICLECCAAGGECQTEECASEHRHHSEYLCPTIRALDGGEQP